jgi:riboflavin biosynthesis pyrimidine reductase
MQQGTRDELEGLAAEARACAESLFGKGVVESTGVTQVSAVVRAPDGRLRVIDIGNDPPRSETDFFALNLARARADAILTSAENIRREPMLSHRLAGLHADGLEALRSVLAKSAPRLCAVLTGSGDLPREHPVWEDGTEKFVLTVPGVGQKVRALLGNRAQIVELPDLTPRSAVAWLRQRVETIDVEAGPRTTNALYQAPALIDELLLSRFEGVLPSPKVGGALPPDAELFEGLSCVHEVRRDEESGPWVFQRWRR